MTRDRHRHYLAADPTLKQVDRLRQLWCDVRDGLALRPRAQLYRADASSARWARADAGPTAMTRSLG